MPQLKRRRQGELTSSTEQRANKTDEVHSTFVCHPESSTRHIPRQSHIPQREARVANHRVKRQWSGHAQRPHNQRRATPSERAAQRHTEAHRSTPTDGAKQTQQTGHAHAHSPEAEGPTHTHKPVRRTQEKSQSCCRRGTLSTKKKGWLDRALTAASHMVQLYGDNHEDSTHAQHRRRELANST